MAAAGRWHADRVGWPPPCAISARSVPWGRATRHGRCRPGRRVADPPGGTGLGPPGHREPLRPGPRGDHRCPRRSLGGGVAHGGDRRRLPPDFTLQRVDTVPGWQRTAGPGGCVSSTATSPRAATPCSPSRASSPRSGWSSCPWSLEPPTARRSTGTNRKMRPTRRPRRSRDTPGARTGRGRRAGGTAAASGAVGAAAQGGARAGGVGAVGGGRGRQPPSPGPITGGGPASREQSGPRSAHHPAVDLIAPAGRSPRRGRHRRGRQAVRASAVAGDNDHGRHR